MHIEGDIEEVLRSSEELSIDLFLKKWKFISLHDFLTDSDNGFNSDLSPNPFPFCELKHLHAGAK